MPTLKLTMTVIERTQPDPNKEITLWDETLKGFGCRILPSGRKVLIVMYRSPEDRKLTRHKLGVYGVLTLTEARERAKVALGQVSGDVDPARERRRRIEAARIEKLTMEQLCNAYMNDARAGIVTYRGKPKKPSTLEIDNGRVERHIKPLLGKKLVAEIGADDVRAFYHNVRTGKGIAGEFKGRKRGKARVTGGQTTAGRSVQLLGSIFSYAQRNGFRSDNPVTKFEHPPTRERDRVLSSAEYAALEKALHAMENEYAHWRIPVAAIRLLALSGLRKSEAFGLRWSEVDAENCVLRLTETKAGGSQVRPIGRAAMDVITAMAEAPATAPTAITAPQNISKARRGRPSKAKKNASPYVFPSSKGGPLVSPKVFREAVQRAELEGVTLHVLRHSFATVAGSLELSEFTIATLLGHTRRRGVTGRYTHADQSAIAAAANRVAAVIARRLKGEANVGENGNVELLRVGGSAA